MTYTLQQLAVGSYDLLLDGEIIGSVVKEMQNSTETKGWCAELIDNGFSARRPAPFTKEEHAFDTLAAVVAWLGGPEVIHTRTRR